jgi:PHD/YefM family antitoxin component YafN of YafNO toxin-antitoxin module
MDQKFKQILEELTKASTTESMVTVSHKDKPVAVILPVVTYQQFQAQREKNLEELRAKLDSLLTFVRTHTRRKSVEEIEAHIATLRQKIEQEMKDEQVSS